MSQRSNRVSRLESITGPPRIFCVRRYEGETADDAFAAEHPGEIASADDLVVVITQFSGLTRAEVAR